MNMLLFASGLVIGGTLGVIFMAALQINKGGGMREIRFRMWEPLINRMSAVSALINTGSYDRIWEAQPDGERYFTPNCVLMQDTGIKDRNGNPVYEGDVVRWYVNGVTRTGIVDWVEDSACFDLKNFHDEYHVCNDWHRGEYEVLGNVHQHPHLLESP